MKAIVIDDDVKFLNAISQCGLYTLCCFGRSVGDMAEEVKNLGDHVELIVVNATLKLESSNKRSEIHGLILLQQLGYRIFDKRFLVVSFFSKNALKRARALAARVLEAEEVDFSDIFEFLQRLYMK